MTVPVGRGLRSYRQKALMRLLGWVCRRLTPSQDLHDPVAVMLHEIHGAYYAHAVVMGEHHRRALGFTDMDFQDDEVLGLFRGLFPVIEGTAEDSPYYRGLAYEYLNHVWTHFLDREIANAGNVCAPENAPAVLKWVAERGYWVMRTTRMESQSQTRMGTYIKGRRREIGMPAPNMVPEVQDGSR